MKKILSLLIILLFAIDSNAQTCSELFISEYVEGSFNNKAIEIYNPTAQAINLQNYRLVRWANGESVISNLTYEILPLPNTNIAAHDVYVIVINTQDIGTDTLPFADLVAHADVQLCTTCAAGNNIRTMCFNGDDALSLQKNVSGNWVNVDIFGVIGERPTNGNGGTSPTAGWTAVHPYYARDVNGSIPAGQYFNYYWTLDQTLVRKASVTNGVATNPGTPYTAAWNPAAQWDSLPVNTFSNLGTHTCACNSASCINVTFISDDQTVCGFTDATFQVTATGTSTIHYQWQVDDGNGFANIANGLHYSGATTNTLTVISPDNTFDGNVYRVAMVDSACGTNITYSDARQLTISNAPTAVIAGQPSVVTTQAYNYTVTNYNNTTNLWGVSGGTINSGQGTNTVNITWNGTAPMYVWYKRTNNNGGCFDIDTMIVNLTNCAIQLDVLVSGITTTVCIGDEVYLIADASGASSFLWYHDGFPYNAQVDDSLLVTESGNYFVVATGSGCSETSAIVPINFLPAPPAVTYTNINPVVQCGQPVTLGVTTPYEHYLWSTGDTTATITIDTSGMYSVTLTAATGCVRQLPPVAVEMSVAPDVALCLVTFDDTTALNKLVWTKPVTAQIDSFIIYRRQAPDPYTQLHSQPYNAPGVYIDATSFPHVISYDYMLATRDVCGTISLPSTPHKTIYVQAGLSSGNTINWTAYLGVPVSNYAIYRGSTNNNLTLLTTVPNNTTNFIDPSPLIGYNYYQIRIEDAPNCGAYDTIRSNIALVVIDNIAEESVLGGTVYPNPTTHAFMVDLGKQGNYTYQLMDISGRIVLGGNFNTAKHTIGIDNLSNSIYYLNVVDAQGKHGRFKVVKM